MLLLYRAARHRVKPRLGRAGLPRSLVLKWVIKSHLLEVALMVVGKPELHADFGINAGW